jgi:hypothetical protein
MFKRTLVTAAVMVAVLAVAAPAWAHEEINPSSISTGKPVFLTLSAANEAKADLVKIGITAPKSVPMGATTREPSGWTVSTKDTSAVVWQASSGGGVKPAKFETWGFETDGADQPGSYTYKVAMTFADGKTDNVEVPLTVGAGSSSTGATASAPTTVPGAAGASTTVAPATTTAAPKAKKTSNKATLALILGAIALVVSLIALAVAMSRRRAAGPGAAAAPPAGKDW